jgi:5-methylcytosine-specific restriction endonuclease McrA
MRGHRQECLCYWNRKGITMKNEKADAASVWKQIEDVLVPRLGLSTVDRAVYAHVLRHSRLEGKPRLHFSIAWLARGAGLSHDRTRHAVRRLLEQGMLRLLKRSQAGHTVEVRLPDEIRLDLVPGLASRKHAPRKGADAAYATLEEIDFLGNPAMRAAIHARERGFCFYCLRRVEAEEEKTLDHVVPRVEGGGNSYRNLVSCCPDCNSYKGGKPADDYLRRLYREGWLTAVELRKRLRALQDLAEGKLRPVLGGTGKAMPCPYDSRDLRAASRQHQPHPDCGSGETEQAKVADDNVDDNGSVGGNAGGEIAEQPVRTL